MGKTASVSYDDDGILWAEEQARALRERDFSKLDIEHLADEIEDVGRSEKRELANRVASRETGIDEAALPEVSPWDLSATLDDDFWPDL